MKNKHIFLLGALGLCTALTGAFFKISHWNGAHLLLAGGLALQAGSLILLLFKLLRRPGSREFLNS